MIISWLLSKADEDTQETILIGLAIGLAVGLLVGLVYGLAFGLVFGLAAGLAFGLAAGLVFGLAAGLAFGLAVGLAAGIFPFDVLFVLAVLAIIEILYWLDKKKKPAKDNKWWFVVERKLEAAIEVGLGLGAVAYIIEAQKHLWSIYSVLLF
jgi:hypothetical protein